MSAELRTYKGKYLEHHLKFDRSANKFQIRKSWIKQVEKIDG